jgi:hypothetical protein
MFTFRRQRADQQGTAPEQAHEQREIDEWWDALMAEYATDTPDVRRALRVSRDAFMRCCELDRAELDRAKSAAAQGD